MSDYFSNLFNIIVEKKILNFILQKKKKITFWVKKKLSCLKNLVDLNTYFYFISSILVLKMNAYKILVVTMLLFLYVLTPLNVASPCCRCILFYIRLCVCSTKSIILVWCSSSILVVVRL